MIDYYHEIITSLKIIFGLQIELNNGTFHPDKQIPSAVYIMIVKHDKIKQISQSYIYVTRGF